MEVRKIIEGLHPLERKVLLVLAKSKTLDEAMTSSALSQPEVMRAFQWLQNKGIVNLKEDLKEIAQLDKNGLSSLNYGLPEKRFLLAIKDKPLSLSKLIASTKLEREEVNACIGILKGKAAIDVKKEGAEMWVSITEQGKKLVSKESLEEQFFKISF